MMPNTPESRSTVAADYVLGTLQGVARTALERRMQHDARLRKAVHRWERHFNRLLGGYRPVQPSDDLWSRLQVAALRSAPTDLSSMNDAPATESASPALVAPRRKPAAAAAPPASKPPARAQGRTPPRIEPAAPLRAGTPSEEPTLARRASAAPAARGRRAPVKTRRTAPLPWLKIWAVAATVVATVFGGLLGVQQLDRPAGELTPPGTYVAALSTDGGRWVVQATVDGQQLLVIAEGTLKLPANRSAELWWIGTDGTPVSMGVIPTSGRQVLTREQAMPDYGAPTFAVSVEPTGGSPTGAPTGKVITTFEAIRSL